MTLIEKKKKKLLSGHCYYSQLFFQFFGYQAYGISVPQPGIEPTPPAVKVQGLNHWTTSKMPIIFILKMKHSGELK